MNIIIVHATTLNLELFQWSCLHLFVLLAGTVEYADCLFAEG